MGEIPALLVPSRRKELARGDPGVFPNVVVDLALERLGERAKCFLVGRVHGGDGFL